MNTDAKDNETLSYLLDLEKDILKEYNAFGTDQFSKEYLMTLLQMESDLLNSLDLNTTKLAKIKKYIENKIGVSLRFNMACGASPFMTDATYPYFRLYARLRNLINGKSTNLFKLVESSFLDLEVPLLYKSLFIDSAKHHSIKKDLQRYALMILIDSPVAEYEILKNDMQPLDSIDDALDFQIDFWAVVKVKRKCGFTGIPSKNNAKKLRRYRYSLVSQEVSKTMEKYFDLRESGQNTEKDIMMCVSYLKTLIACLSKEERMHEYESFAQCNKDNLMKDEDYAKFIESSLEDIETKLVPSLKKVSFCRSKIKG